MTEPGEDADGVYVEHQYMCSECHELFNTLEDVLVHQQIHSGAEGDGEQEVSIQDMTEMEETQQYQCLECGALLVNSDELLQHQEMHMREAGMEVEHQGEGRWESRVWDFIIHVCNDFVASSNLSLRMSRTFLGGEN